MRGHSCGQMAHLLPDGGFTLQADEQLRVLTRWSDEGLVVSTRPQPGVIMPPGFQAMGGAKSDISGDFARSLLFAGTGSRQEQVKAEAKALQEEAAKEEAALAARQGEWKYKMSLNEDFYAEQMAFADSGSGRRTRRTVREGDGAGGGGGEQAQVLRQCGGSGPVHGPVQCLDLRGVASLDRTPATPHRTASHPARGAPHAGWRKFRSRTTG